MYTSVDNLNPLPSSRFGEWMLTYGLWGNVHCKSIDQYCIFKVQDLCVGSVNLVKSFHKCWHPAKLNWGVGKIVLGTDDSQ